MAQVQPMKKSAMLALVNEKPKTREAALNMLDRIMRRNWLKGNYYRSFGVGSEEVEKVCLIQGIRNVNGPKQSAVEQSVCIAIVELFPSRVSSCAGLTISKHSNLHNLLSQIDDTKTIFNADQMIPSFNDHSQTTKKDILRVVARARTIKEAILAHQKINKQAVKTRLRSIWASIDKQIEALKQERTKAAAAAMKKAGLRAVAQA